MDSPEDSHIAEEINPRGNEDSLDQNDSDPSQDDDELDLSAPEPHNVSGSPPAPNDLPESATGCDDLDESSPASPHHHLSSEDDNNSGPQSPDADPQSPDPELHSPDHNPCSPDRHPHSPDLNPHSPDNDRDEKSEVLINEKFATDRTSELCDPDNETSILGDDTTENNSNSTKTQNKTFSEQTEKTSENDSDCGSLNSSLVSQRTLENVSENFSDSQRPALTRDDGDFEKDSESVGGSSKAEEESRVVVGLEELENLATENGRCGSPSIVSEAADTLAGSLVVETGSVGGESGTVRSMPQSEVSDYDYQNVENGDEGAESEEEYRESEERIHDDVSDSGEIVSDEEASLDDQSGPKSPPQSDYIEDSRKHDFGTVGPAETNQDGLEPDSTVHQAESQAAENGAKTGVEAGKSESEGEYAENESEEEIVEKGSGGAGDRSESGDMAADDDFDYDDLDLDAVSESEPARDHSTATESSKPADSSMPSKDRQNKPGSESSPDQRKIKLAQNTATQSRENQRHVIDSSSGGRKSNRSPKVNLSEDHVELDYDEEDIVEEKVRHIEMEDDELENGELPDDEEEGEADDKSDDGELEDDDDCEEGEIREPGNRKPFVKPICRFYLNGKCTWGNNCRFLHPGVNDKGNYRLIERPGFNNTGPGMRGPMGPGNWGPGEGGPELDFIPPVVEPQPTESAWERGLRHAKELMKKASHRKETDPGFEEKRLNLTVEEEREFNKENDLRRLGDKDPYLDPHIDDDFFDKPSIGWQQGQYENFEVRWNRAPEYSPYRDKDRGFVDRRGPTNFSNHPHSQGPPMHLADRFNNRRDDRREKFREPVEEPFVPTSGGAPRERADVWHDPWRRSKSPKRKLRESPSRSRSRGRRRYRRSYSYSSSYSSSSLSGSSRSRSRSSYSSFTSRSSISRSSFSSRSRTRSEDLTRRRPPQEPAGTGIPHSGGPSPLPVGPAGGKPGAFVPGAGPAGDRKQQPPNKSGEPRSAVAVRQRQPRPGTEKRRPVIGPMPRQPVRDRPPPPMGEGRGRGMRDREDRGRGRGRGIVNQDPVLGPPGGKKRGASRSSSGSSQSRSRSRSSSSTSRSRSKSSASSSSSSSSSSGSADSEHLYRDIAEPDAQDKERPQPAGQGREKSKAASSDKEAGTRPGRPEKDRPHRGSKDRPRDKRARYSSPGPLPPGGRGRASRPETRRDPSDATGRPQVSSTTTTTKSKDPMKSVGQKSNIKLTLISKPSEKNGMAGRKRPAEGSTSAPPPAKKPPVSPIKQLTDKGGKAITRGDKPAPVPSPRMKPPQAVGRPNQPNIMGRPLTSPAKPVAKLTGTTASAASAAAAAKAAKKSTSSRREELLKQLKAVEDAIARKRSKLP